MPGKEVSYIVLMGITAGAGEISRIFNKFNSPARVRKALEGTKAYWAAIAENTRISSGDKGFDNWFRWVSVQPALRRIFGCSFLPDFDYGKGAAAGAIYGRTALGLY